VSWQIITGDCLESLATLPDQSVQCCITSPPYWGLRDYGVDGQLGLESTPDEYVSRMVAVFREVRRVLRDDGTLWLNLGDTYLGTGYGPGTGGCPGVPGQFNQSREKQRIAVPTGLKPKDLTGIPWRVAFALQADGWYLRSDIIWAKPNPMPESVTDRPTKAHEYVFLLSKSPKYFYDADAVREGAAGGREKFGGDKWGDKGVDASRNDQGRFDESIVTTRNRRTVWSIATQPFPGAHFAVFPPALVIPMVDAGCPEGGTVLDPFSGSGTTGIVAVERGRSFIGCELNQEYADMARGRLEQASKQGRLDFGEPAPNPEQTEMEID
jgi:site-specific DNA-methyltransferase (adenine-specific)